MCIPRRACYVCSICLGSWHGWFHINNADNCIFNRNRTISVLADICRWHTACESASLTRYASMTWNIVYRTHCVHCPRRANLICCLWSCHATCTNVVDTSKNTSSGRSVLYRFCLTIGWSWTILYFVSRTADLGGRTLTFIPIVRGRTVLESLVRRQRRIADARHFTP